MTDPVIRSRIDPVLKAEANRILRSMGLTMSDAIRLFLHQVVSEKGLPFPVKAPNAETVAAMEAADRGEYSPTTLEQLAKDWDETCAK
ncbi:MAG: type II toxin-antitoxin system RelB/DinJ family antitoxin [Pseudomonadota bacterium]|nr:type II toxin-antitoxin system RelB/DinJ family antitoxin [Pseudomonadota bacterium]